MNILSVFQSTVARKQIAALTGLSIWGFVVAHLAGNLFIYGGAEVYNRYAAKLAGLRPLLSIMEFFLVVVALIHIITTLSLFLENRPARKRRYSTYKPSGTYPLSSRIVAFTGPLILVYVIFHLLDFTFSDHSGPRAIVNEANLGLYGVVFNSFKNPLHAGAYILGMIVVGLHLNHAIQSACQTFGLNNQTLFPHLRRLSVLIGVSIAILYSSIPVTILFNIIKPG